MTRQQRIDTRITESGRHGRGKRLHVSYGMKTSISLCFNRMSYNTSNADQHQDTAHWNSDPCKSLEISSNARPEWQLDVTCQPERVTSLLKKVGISVKVSLKMLQSRFICEERSRDITQLLALVSLVACRRDNSCTSAEPDLIVASSMFDTVHIAPSDSTQTIADGEMGLKTLGYFHFSELMIRRIGLYRVRVTLLHTPGPFQDWITTVAFVDSEQIEVKAYLESAHD